MKQVTDDNGCFACGEKNRVGLKLIFSEKNKKAVSSVTVSNDFQGWKGIVHGGIISTMLDEAMVKAASLKKIPCVTAEINVKFKTPCYTGKEYLLSGEISEIKRNILFSSACIEDMDGKVIAEARGKLFIIKKYDKE